jgi:hypothetical protein
VSAVKATAAAAAAAHCQQHQHVCPLTANYSVEMDKKERKGLLVIVVFKKKHNTYQH